MMDKLSKVSNKVKILILLIYTFLAVGLGVLIASTQSKSKQFISYSNLPYDDNITLNLRMIEKRQSSEENQSDYEKAAYDMYVFVTKKISGATIENMKFYIALKTNSDQFRYVEYSTTGKTMSSGTYTSMTSFLNSSTSFSVKTVTKDDKKLVKVDQEPVEVYLKVTYTISINDKRTDHQLNYKTSINDQNENKMSGFSQRNIISNAPSKNGYIENIGEIFDLRIDKKLTDKNSTTKNVEYDYLKASIYANSANLGDREIEQIAIDIFGKVKNDASDAEDYFSNYVRMFSYYGTLTTARNIPETEQNIDERYDITELYIVGSVRFKNGKSDVVSYKVKVSDLFDY